MGLLDLFDSRDKKKRLSHIRNLIVLACADGHCDTDEMNLIMRIAVKSGLTVGELERIVQRPDSCPFYPPDTFVERVEQLYDMVLVMMIDGELHKKEILFCKGLAVKLGFKHQVIDKIVENLIDAISKGIALNILLQKLKEWDI